MKKTVFLLAIITLVLLLCGSLDAKASNQETWNINAGETTQVHVTENEVLGFLFNIPLQGGKIYKLPITEGVDKLLEKGVFKLEASGQQVFDDTWNDHGSSFKEHYGNGQGCFHKFNTYRDQTFSFSVTSGEAYAAAFDFSFIVEEEIIPVGTLITDAEGRVLRAAGGNKVYLYSEPYNDPQTYGTLSEYKIDGVSYEVVGICSKAFTRCSNMRNLYINVGGDIEANAFKGCKKLEVVDIQYGLKSIGKNAFNGCKKIKRIDINCNSLTTIGKNAFKGTTKNTKINILARDKSLFKTMKKKIKKAGATTKKYKYVGFQVD